MDDPVDDCGDGHRVKEDLRPGRERQIRRHYQAPPLVALADEAEQQVGADLVEGRVSKLVEDDDAESAELVELALEAALLLRLDG